MIAMYVHIVHTIDMGFEWNDATNQSNISKHGISFDTARRIFDGPLLTAIDDRFDYGEVREISVGLIEKYSISGGGTYQEERHHEANYFST